MNAARHSSGPVPSVGGWGRLARTQALVNHLVRTRATGPGEPAAFGVLVDRTPLVTLATKVGATALVTGASGSDATGMILRLGLTHGVRFQVDVTYTSVVVGWPDGDGVPLTMLRTVPALDRDYARLAHLHAVVDAVADGSLSVADATVELDRRGATGFTYRRWVLWLAAFVQVPASAPCWVGPLWRSWRPASPPFSLR